MRIFILEDNKQRIAKFKRELIGHEIDYAETIQQGTSLVVTNQYDLLFLDHDLGEKEMVNSFNDNTGYRLAEFIASFTPNKETPCIVHSCNPAGSDNIIRVLPHAVKLPFPSLDIASVIKWVEQLPKKELNNLSEQSINEIANVIVSLEIYTRDLEQALKECSEIANLSLASFQSPWAKDVIKIVDNILK